MTWFFIRLLSNRLRALEKHLVKCMVHAVDHTSGDTLLRADLLLAIKAVACLRATLRLLEQEMWQEAEGARRTFLETWALMMHFAWLPEDSLLSVWSENPEKYLSEGNYHIRQGVEPLLPRRLQMPENAYVALRDDFRFLSNTAVHPTRESAERSWSDAAWRWRRLVPKEGSRESRGWRTYNLQLSLALLASYVHLFLRFLRLDVFILPELAYRFRQKHPSFLESFLTLWLKYLEKQLRLAVEKAKTETAGDDGT